jgi:Ca2+-binding RTX toxin-like protein
MVANLVLALPAVAARARCFGQLATIVGTRGDDEIRGTRGRDVIVAKGGNDLIMARGGNDLICAGGGEFDVVFAGAGNDRISGGRGFDVAFPAGGDDFFDGGPRFDLVTYEGTQRPVNANLGTGRVTGQGTDRLRSVEGVAGSEGDDTLIGTDASDDLLGYGGNDTITAGDGDDFINSGAGNDTIDGGLGHDFVDFAFAHAGPRLDDDTLTDAGAEINLVTGSATGGEGVGTDTLTSIEGVGGTLGDDTIVGNDTFNDIVGFEGDDTINLGGPGDPDDLGTQDLAFPGGGNDTVIGSTGTDAVDYTFNSLVMEPAYGVTADLQAGTATGLDIGNDVLTSIETFVGTFFSDTITGSPTSNLLVGLDGSDTLNGGAGDDVLDGDAYVFGLDMELDGNDTIDGGPGTDVCVGGGVSDAGCESAELVARTRLAGLARWGVVSSSYYRFVAGT